MKIEVTKPADADHLWVVADRIRFCGGLAGSDLELLEVEVPPGSGTPPHSHASAEMFYVLEGTLTVGSFAQGAPPVFTEAGKGSTVRIDSRAPHNYSNAGNQPVRMLVLIEAAMVAFFRDIGAAEPQSQPNFERIGAAMQRHGVEMAAMAA
ncbi:MAG: cupin domain-containing protein [Cypionkella sp.]